MANDVQLSPKGQVLKDVSAKLQNLLEKQANALPKNFNQTRFLQNCLTVLNDTKDIEKCTPISITRTMIKGAYLGLDFFRRECYAIPYDGNVQFQTDYKGEIKLAKMYSTNPIRDIYAKLVREGDDLEVRVDQGKQIVNFKPLQFNDGKVIGAFAIAYFEDGSMIYDAMSIKEMEEIRKQYSKAPNSPAWVKSPGEMYKKVILRRLCKMISLDFDNAEQDVAYEEGADTVVKPGKETIETTADVADPFAPQVPAEDPDAELRKKLQKEYPAEAPWQIDVRIKEAKGAAA